MYRSRLLILCLGLLLSLTACSSDDSTSPDEGDASQNPQSSASKIYETDSTPAPDLTIETLGGETINLAEQQGKVVLVNFWATWCAPCRREIPDLIDLYEDLRSEGLLVVGIAVDREGDEVVEPFVEDEEVNYPIVLDPEQSIEKHFEAMYGLPTTYLINSEGQIVRRILGVFPVDKMKPKLEKMLDDEKQST
jgi:peroxiredoxin